jgi:hypothetical protein
MTVKLNLSAFNHAKKLIQQGQDVIDERKDWSEDQPSAEQENEFINQHGFSEYGKWYLGVDDDKPENTKERYEFPYGNFTKVHRCGLISAESRAGQYKHFDIETAAKELLGMIKKS